MYCVYYKIKSMYKHAYPAYFSYCAISLTSLSGIALADDNQPIEHSNSSPTEVIVITGSRQASDLLSFAGNVDRISTEDINIVSAVHPSDILNRATGVHIQTNNGMESLPSVRSPVLTGPGAEIGRAHV